MYKKILFGSIAILFAAASAFNIGLLQTKDAGDISLDAIAIMAQAHNGESESGGGGEATKKAWVWKTTGKECITPEGMHGQELKCQRDDNAPYWASECIMGSLPRCF